MPWAKRANAKPTHISPIEEIVTQRARAAEEGEVAERLQPALEVARPHQVIERGLIDGAAVPFDLVGLEEFVKRFGLGAHRNVPSPGNALTIPKSVALSIR